MDNSSQVKNSMAGQATETLSSKTISSIEENTSSVNINSKMINSTTEDNSTQDEYEKEFERVMQEQEQLEIYGRNADTVTLNCDILRTDKQRVSPINSGESFIPIHCAPCPLNPVQTSTQCKNHKSASDAISGGESFTPIDCASRPLNLVQTPTQCKNNSEPSRNKSSASTAISGGEAFIPIDCASRPLNPVQTPTQCENNSEPSCNNSASAALSGDVTSVQIKLKEPPSQKTKTHNGLGNRDLSRNDSNRVDYPSELNPFSDDDETEKGKSTNPFGDSDDEENALLTKEIPPKPRPRHSFSTVKGLEHRYRLPVPLPRTASKSVPTTPNQSPLLRVSHSFHQPSPSASTYNSIRRKKKPAPPPPNHPIPDSLQSSPIASPKTNSRPRKTRLAPPPPKPATTTPS